MFFKYTWNRAFLQLSIDLFVFNMRTGSNTADPSLSQSDWGTSCLCVPSCCPCLPCSITSTGRNAAGCFAALLQEAPSPRLLLSPLRPAPAYPLRYPIASPAAAHLLLGENRLLGNRFLKQQLWLCYSLNFTLPAWNNEHAWLVVHMCIYNPRENAWPLLAGACLPFCSLLFTAGNTEFQNGKGFFGVLCCWSVLY